MSRPIILTDLDDSRNRQARRLALSRVSLPINLAPETVGYDSQGHLLILGGDLDIRRAAAALIGRLPSITLLVTERSEAEADDIDRLWAATESLPCFIADGGARIRLEGHLGRFLVTLPLDGAAANLARAALGSDHFDLVLDLGRRPLLELELLPPGYHPSRPEHDDYAALLDTLPDQVGEFEKPRYFEIHHDICAHDGRGKQGCTRCLAVCPADAIASHQGRIESWIEIDPFLCHGAGSCTSACPTGAIEYRLPRPERLEHHLVALLATYREAGGEQPVVRFADRDTLASELDEPAGHVIDIPLEELGAAGLDQWLAALAAGAAEVRLQASATLPPTLRRLVDDQLAQARGLLESLGHSPRRIEWIAATDAEARDALPHEPALAARPPAGSPPEGKRERLEAVLDWLADQGRPSGRRHAMPANAPFGTLEVATDGCTLCMGCVAVCPTPALAGGDDTAPRLSLREADCIQCGLCQATCPEQVIRLQPGFLAAPERRERLILKEEPAFACIRCGKPFATTSTVSAIKARLADHPYFAGEAMARLEMCEDCRVREVIAEGFDPHDENQRKVRTTADYARKN